MLWLNEWFAQVEKRCQGACSWSTDPWVRLAYSTDLWPRFLIEQRELGEEKVRVDGVFWPHSAEVLARFLKASRKDPVVFYPYGAGSGVCGAAIANQKDRNRFCVTIDCKRLQKVRSLDLENQMVVVESGILGENLERFLAAQGHTLGHFPSSIYCSSLGGYLATRSAGQLSTKYGKIEDMVLGLEVVLPTGEIVSLGKAPRSAMGPDWMSLFLGSEGKLGVITAAKLQIHPKPTYQAFLSFFPKTISEAIFFSRSILQQGLRPSAMRIYDPMETALTIPKPFREGAPEKSCAMIVLFEETLDFAKVQAQQVKAFAKKHEIVLGDGSLCHYWWEHRYHVSYQQQKILRHHGMILDTFEVAAFWDRLAKVYEAVKSIKIPWGMVLAHFSHFYRSGANIYFTLVAHQGCERALEKYDQIWQCFLKKAYQTGATLSHHHGMGVVRGKWYLKEAGACFKLYRQVKHVFDPENRFAPFEMGT